MYCKTSSHLNTPSKLYISSLQGLKDKRRSMDEMANDDRVKKKPRQSFEGYSQPSPSTSSAGTRSDFSPFQYEGKNFSDFARGASVCYSSNFPLIGMYMYITPSSAVNALHALKHLLPSKCFTHIITYSRRASKYTLCFVHYINLQNSLD